MDVRPIMIEPEDELKTAGEGEGGEEREGAPQGPSQEEGFLFLDPYWDDVFASYYDPTLRTCCTID